MKNHSRSAKWRSAFILGSVASALGGCGVATEEDIASMTQAAGSVTISGKVTTSSGAGIAGVTVTLAGRSEGTAVTTATGQYSFPGLSAGSYSLRPTKAGCLLNPDVVNLNNLSSSKVQNFSGSGAGCSAVAAPAKAVVLVDQRLYALLTSEIDTYLEKARAARGFGIELRVVQGIDDWSFTSVRDYLRTVKSQVAALEGVLFIGNIKMPSFYKTRNDIVITENFPHYYEDLDGDFRKTYADGAIDPSCDSVAPGDPNCRIDGPALVPPHDLDYQAKGQNPDPELWASYMPVGVTGSANDYATFANQLRPYLNKVIAYYNGVSPSNGRYYLVSNDAGRLEDTWSAFGAARIDFYGKPGPNGETDGACTASGTNVCYVRWPTEAYGSAAEFMSYFASFPWVGEGWQAPGIYLGHMGANAYDVVEVNVHSTPTDALAHASEVRTMTGGGRFVALDGCQVGAFKQPGSPSGVGTTINASDNVLLSYLYGSSRAVAASGDPSWRGHYGHHSLMYRAMKVDGDYLGKAHFRRMQKQYEVAGTSAYELKEHTAESLVGDPFMKL